MKFKTDEMELGIAINAADKEAMITVTGYQTYLRKLEKLSKEFPEDYKLLKEHLDPENGEIYARQYLVNKKYVRFGKPASAKRIEQGKAAAARMRELSNT
jgi:hypothetical protein